MIKAVIFDIDGTLIDSVDAPAASWVSTFERFGFQVSFDQVRERIGEGADRLLPALLPPGVGEETRKEIEEFRADLFRREYLPKVKALPGARALFERVRAAGQKVVLASSCKSDEIARYKQIADIEDLVDAEATADDADCSKPSPDIFQAALERIAPIRADE